MFSTHKHKLSGNIYVMWCPHCSAGMEPVIEPKIEILVFRCWICGERVYPRGQRELQSSQPQNIRCSQCGKTMAVDEKGRKKCAACIEALRASLGEGQCIICGNIFAKRRPYQQTCGPECQHQRQIQTTAMLQRFRKILVNSRMEMN